MSTSWDEYQQEISERDSLLIVDGLNLAFRYKHKGATDFGMSYLATVNSLAKSYFCRDVIILSDYGKSTYRKEIYPEYKGDREEKYKDQTEEEKAKTHEFFEGYEKALELCAKVHNVVKLKGVEADDTAGYIINKYGHLYKDIWLISTDVDWDQYLCEKVHRWAYTTRREFTIDNFYEHHGCDSPEQLTHIKAIMGDLGDNVRGIDGLGIKRTYNIVREFGNVFEIISQMPLPGKQKYITALNNNKDLLLRNLELMDLPTYYMDAIAHAAKVYDTDYFKILDNLELKIAKG